MLWCIPTKRALWRWEECVYFKYSIIERSLLNQEYITLASHNRNGLLCLFYLEKLSTYCCGFFKANQIKSGLLAII